MKLRVLRRELLDEMAKKVRDKRRKTQRRQKQRLRSEVVGVSERQDIGPGEFMLNHRAARLAEIIAAYPQQIALGLAGREDAGWLFGRLYLVGAIDQDQKSAAEKLSKAVVTYRRLFHKHYGPKMSVVDPDVLRANGRSGEDLSAAAEKAFERASKEYERNMGLLRVCGHQVKQAVMVALDSDTLSDLNFIRRGLDSLCGRGKVVENGEDKEVL